MTLVLAFLKIYIYIYICFFASTVFEYLEQIKTNKEVFIFFKKILFPGEQHTHNNFISFLRNCCNCLWKIMTGTFKEFQSKAKRQRVNEHFS